MTVVQMNINNSARTADVQEEIILAAQRCFERLPVFEMVLERAVQSLGPTIRAGLNVTADVTLQAVNYIACADALAEAPDPGLVALANASPWGGALAVTLDPGLLFAAIEIMLGAPDSADAQARQTSERAAWQPRAFTAIEKRLGGTLVALVLREVAAAFAPLGTVAFSAGTIESGPRDVLLAPLSAGCLRATIQINLEGRGGTLCLIVPHRTLDPVRPLLTRPRAAGQLGEDPGSRAALSQSLNDTPVTLTAVLHEQDMPLADVLDWQLGQVLDLGIDAAHEVSVSCSGRDMFRAAIGCRKTGSVALRITSEIDRTRKEIPDGTSD